MAAAEQQEGNFSPVGDAKIIDAMSLRGAGLGEEKAKGAEGRGWEERRGFPELSLNEPQLSFPPPPS